MVLAPLAVEALAVRAGLRGAGRVVRVGMGGVRAESAARRADLHLAEFVVVAGVCGAVDPGLRPGDVVVATSLLFPDGRSETCPGGAALAVRLRQRGLRVVAGPVAGVERIAGPAERAALEGRAVAVDMESPWLARAGSGRPFAAARVVVDTRGRRLADPRTILAGLRALLVLRRVGAALAGWSPPPGATIVGP